MAEQEEMSTREEKSSGPLIVEERKVAGTGPTGEAIMATEADDDVSWRLKLANAARRCHHVRADGSACKAPRIKSGLMCYAHTRMLAVRPKALRLPPLEDANGVQLAIMEVARAALDGAIDRKMAALLFYGLRIAATNVCRATLGNFEFTDVLSLGAPKIQQDPPAGPSSLKN